MSRNKRYRRENKRLVRALIQAGFDSCGVWATTPGGKVVGFWLDYDFPPHIDDRVIYGTSPMFAVVQFGADGYSESTERQAVSREPSGPEPIRYDDERPEILAFALEQLHSARTKLVAMGATEVELERIALTRPFPPVHITLFTGDSEARQLTDEEIRAILEDPNEPEYVKDMVRTDLEARKHFRWVGGSPFSDECWELVRYAGIRLVVRAFFPTEAVQRLIA